jgi:hypothetical protein
MANHTTKGTRGPPRFSSRHNLAAPQHRGAMSRPPREREGALANGEAKSPKNGGKPIVG